MAAGSLSYATYVIAATLEVENQRAALYCAVREAIRSRRST